MGSVFGHLLRLSTFGESHGGGVGVVLEGVPPRLELDVAEIQRDLDRRRPGQSVLTTPRNEADQAEILSGVFEGRTLGTPIAILVRNKDARPSAYDELRETYRPSHADFTTEAKYGIRNWQGGGRASARETIGRVAAGAIARKLLREQAGVEVLAWVQRVKDIDAKVDPGVGAARGGRGERRALSRRRRGRADVRADRRDAARGRLRRRRRRVRGARRAGGARGSGLRQARSGPGEGGDVAAGGKGLRDRVRLRRHAALGQRAQRRVHHRRGRPHPARRPTAPAASRAGSATASRSTCGSPSSRPRRSARSKRR